MTGLREKKRGRQKVGKGLKSAGRPGEEAAQTYARAKRGKKALVRAGEKLLGKEGGRILRSE